MLLAGLAGKWKLKGWLIYPPPFSTNKLYGHNIVRIPMRSETSCSGEGQIGVGEGIRVREIRHLLAQFVNSLMPVVDSIKDDSGTIG
ncbi:hypothetical protein D9M68_510960 [compost metagenome]